MALKNVLFRNLKLQSSILMSNHLVRCRSGVERNMSSHKTEVNGVHLHYEVEGNSPNVILFMPGALGSTQSDFGPQLKELSKRFTVVAFDPRGYGKSVPPKRDFPKTFFERDANDAAELMTKIGHERFSILGWSDGGITGMILAGEKPELVNKLIVWGSNAFIDEEDVRLISNIRDLSKWSKRMKEPLEELYGKENLQSLWSSWVDAFLSFKDNPEDGICIKSLAKIQAPTLVIHGAKDPIVPELHANFLHENIRNSRLHTFADGKHNLHLRYHTEFNALVSEFLSS